jgi:hypothetical protein
VRTRLQIASTAQTESPMAASARVAAARVDDEWRRWIAENLLLNHSPPSVYGAMLRAGIPAMEAQNELQHAMRSPYLTGAQRLRNRLEKRDWLLETQRSRSQLRDRLIERRHKLPASEFLDSYYTAGRPVIITGMMDDWPAMSKWSLQYLRQRFGSRTVEVQFDREADPRYEINKNEHARSMLFGDYLAMVEQGGRTNDFYMTAYNEGRNRTALADLWEDIVQVPEYLDASGDHKGFLWVGPAGTVTPLHHDLSNIFMAQVVGRKRVQIISSTEVAHLYNSEACFSPVDGRSIDFERYPLMSDVNVLTCTLEPGELLFLPVGCWHFVEGLEASVMVSFINFRWDNDFTAEYPKDQVF